jgi:hypothetical protein
MHLHSAAVVFDESELTGEVSSGGSVSKYMVAFLVLVIAWVCAWIVFHVTSVLIHILLVVALVCLILHFVRGRHGEADLRIRS